MTSPTQRSLALCRSQGMTVQVVERWCAFSRRRIDLFGIIDLVAINENFIIGIQTTSGSCVSARLAKALESEPLKLWLTNPSRRFFIHGWRKLVVKPTKKPTKKKSKRYLYDCREIELTLNCGEIVVTEE